MLRSVELLDEAGLASVIQVQRITAIADFAAKERTDITCVADIVAAAQETEITAVADISSSLQSTYFILPDVGGTVGFWINIASGGSIPAGASGATRAVEITTISADDSANTIAGKLETAIHADSKFTASSALAVCTVTNVDLALFADAADGDSGFGFSTSVPGITADLLDGTYFVLQDEVGSVAFWIDTDNSGTAEPSHGAARAVEIVTVTSGMSATAVGGVVYTAIVADSKFAAGADNGDGTIEVLSTTYGSKTAGVDGDTGFTITVGIAGDAGLDQKYFLLNDVAGSVAFWIDLDNSGSTAPTHGADRAVEITTISTGDSAATIAGLLETAIHGDSKFTASSATIYCTVTNVDIGNIDDPSDGDTGFTFLVTVDGYTQPNVASDAQDIRDARSYCATVEWTSSTCSATVKMQESNDGILWADTPSATGAQAILNNNGSAILNLSDRAAAYCRAQIAYTSGTLTTANVVFNSK